jgi:hypothetical protein
MLFCLSLSENYQRPMLCGASEISRFEINSHSSNAFGFVEISGSGMFMRYYLMEDYAKNAFYSRRVALSPPLFIRKLYRRFCCFTVEVVYGRVNECKSCRKVRFT